MAIHAFSIGKGILAISPMPGNDGDYEGDLEHITAWAPAIVISLTTPVEMFVATTQDLGHRLQDRGTRWLHLPIEDLQAPSAEFMSDWIKASEAIRRALVGGGRVLLHCKAGCGRSGMVALRLMIEMGEAPDEALARLRAVRPCAIETSEQMDWAMKAERAAATFVRHPDE